MARRLPKGKERICCRGYHGDQKPEDKSDKKLSIISTTPLTFSKDKETKKREKLIEHKKSSKNGKRIGKKPRRKKLNGKIDEEQVQPDLIEEYEFMFDDDYVTKTEEKESKETLSLPDDKCKCQIIKASNK
ncbi:uncharacterized protein LOC124425979 [Vespa crabro]|uniref:uncharacterized protein LOC124425979 n=1 Tax=Vespa crabro TaxID=7445 RepID=UPI001F005D2C|nr:uncharacterized protein LOC124425979 [Vespa crabro]